MDIARLLALSLRGRLASRQRIGLGSLGLVRRSGNGSHLRVLCADNNGALNSTTPPSGVTIRAGADGCQRSIGALRPACGRRAGVHADAMYKSRAIAYHSVQQL